MKFNLCILLVFVLVVLSACSQQVVDSVNEDSDYLNDNVDSVSQGEASDSASASASIEFVDDEVLLDDDLEVQDVFNPEGVDIDGLDEGWDYFVADNKVYLVDDNGCFDFEIYDADLDECFVECDSDEQCDAFDELYVKLFGDDLEDYFYEDYQGDAFFGSDDDEYVGSVSYDISSDGLVFTSEQGDTSDLGNLADHTRIYNSFVNIVPSQYYSDFLTEFLVYRVDDGTLAHVEQTADDPNNWLIGFEYYESTFGDQKEFVHTIIHEYGHLLSLNPSQIDVDVSESSCSTLFTGEGCSFESSFIFDFYNRFWAGDFFDEYEEVSLQGEDALDSFYSKYEEYFVSEYSATSVFEDFSESWALFVLKSRPSDPEFVSEEKIAFFYDYPGLVEQRDAIRKNIASDVLKARRR